MTSDSPAPTPPAGFALAGQHGPWHLARQRYAWRHLVASEDGERWGRVAVITAVDPRTVTVDCPHPCRAREHTHGRGGEGWRAPHCGDELDLDDYIVLDLDGLTRPRRSRAPKNSPRRPRHGANSEATRRADNAQRKDRS